MKRNLICSGTFINKNLIEKFGYLKDDLEIPNHRWKNGYTNCFSFWFKNLVIMNENFWKN